MRTQAMLVKFWGGVRVVILDEKLLVTEKKTSQIESSGIQSQIIVIFVLSFQNPSNPPAVVSKKVRKNSHESTKKTASSLIVHNYPVFPEMFNRH